MHHNFVLEHTILHMHDTSVLELTILLLHDNSVRTHHIIFA